MYNTSQINSSMTSLDKILSFFESGLYNKAISLYSGIDDTALSPNLLNVVAACYFRLGEYLQADQLLQRAEPSLSDNPGFLSLYASNSRLLGDFQKSRMLFAKALDLDPSSLPLKNNFANLLIDEGDLSEAQELLLSVIKSDPEYKDARSNLNRLQYKLSLSSNKSLIDDYSNFSSISQSGFSLVDPLLLAFAEDEVNYAKKRYKLKNDPAVNDILDSLPTDNLDRSINDKLVVARESLSSKNYQFCLQICNSISAKTTHAEIYDIASDAYLNLRRFRESEICLLNALSIGGGTPKRYLNLVTFASMRSDFSLAEYYLEKAASLDPSHPQLAAISNLIQKQKSDSRLSTPFSESWDQPEIVG